MPPTLPGPVKQIKAAQSQDPNALHGPAGYGPSGFVLPDVLFPYRITFENDPAATAPAQRVDITDRLDPNLDWSTFQLTGFGFGDNNIDIPAGSQHYQTTVPMTDNGQTFEVMVRLDFDATTGTLHAALQSIDPESELPPDVLTGFLPPEDGTGRGDGYVTFVVQPKAGLPTGAQIRNVALVQFDLGEIIATDQVAEHDPSQGVDPNKQALNTIDAGSPTSSIDPLPAYSPPNFTLRWTGQDDAGGSGIASFDVYTSDNGGPFSLWLQQTNALSAVFTAAEVGHTYSFYTVATDNVGYTQTVAGPVQSTTVVAGAATSFNDLSAPVITYGTVATTISGQLQAANGGQLTIPEGETVQVTLNGVTRVAALAGDGRFSTSFATGTLSVAGTSYNIGFRYAGDADFIAGSATSTLAVNPAPLTIIANSTSKIYGQTLAFIGAEFTSSGLLNPADAVTSVTLTSAGAAVMATVGGSPYDIVASDAVGSGLGNYTITYAKGRLTVAPATLTITPSSGQSVVYGAPVPVLTYVPSGFVNNDSATLITGALGTTATPASPVGNYSFVLGSLSAGANYKVDLRANPALFAVTPATPSFTDLSAPTIAYRTASATITGHLRPNAGQQAVPAGETVQITVAGLSASATLDSSDNFSASFATDSLIPGASPYVIAFSYGGDADFNAAVSGTSTLVVYVPAVTVVTNPSNQTAGNGAMVTFTATARGFPTPAVQWLVASAGSTNFQPVMNNPTATTNALTLLAQPSETGNRYEAVFTNVGGSATSKPATLTVSGSVPTVTMSPTDETAAAGKPVTFTVQASGSPKPSVQWQVSVDNGNTFRNIAGGGNGKLSFTARAVDNGFRYRAVLNNRYGVAYSAAATLTVASAATAPPVVTTQPTAPANAVNAGQRVTFKAAATDAGAVRWQMSSDGATFSNIAGATASTYAFTAQAAENGYQYRAVFTNPFGQTTTNAVTLAVNPTITKQPAVQTVYDGQTVTFTAAATGNPQPGVQWQVSSDGKQFTPVSGGNVAALIFTASVADRGLHYRAVFTSTVGTITTQAITKAVVLTVRALPTAPVITVQPLNQTSIAGQSVTLLAAAVSNPAATVQWQVRAKGSATFVNIPGATSGTLTFVAQATDNGNQYRAVFSNGHSVSTAVVKLTLGVAPVVTLPPADQTVAVGKTVTFTAAVSASPAATVQWQVSVDGGQTYSNIAGATGLRLTFKAQAQQNGNLYRAVFTNPIGKATTAAALLMT